MHLGVLVCLSCSLAYVLGDALHPVRPETEEAFLKLGHHERSFDASVMLEKIKVIKERRKWEPWDSSNPYVKKILESQNMSKRPNILLILADDLGYGDLSVPPFVTAPDSKWPCAEGGILSPELERMASNGAIMTNFHSASPVCSPSRVAIMTGLYPWRLGALNAFELGRDMSQRNGFLPQVPTLPEILREVIFSLPAQHCKRKLMAGVVILSFPLLSFPSLTMAFSHPVHF